MESHLKVHYPHQDGDTTVLGPETFASSDERVICWKGVNYVRQGTLADDLTLLGSEDWSTVIDQGMDGLADAFDTNVFSPEAESELRGTFELAMKKAIRLAAGSKI